MQFLIAFAAAALAAAAPPSPPTTTRSDPVLVRAVIDGDTIDVTTLGRVRLLGIDAPEIGRGFDTAAPFAREARERLAALVLHRWIRLEQEGTVLDAYERRLAYVMTEDGVCINTTLVREGLARVSARLPLARLDELKRAESEAQRFRRGMWGDTPPIPSTSATAPRGRLAREPKRRYTRRSGAAGSSRRGTPRAKRARHKS